MAKIEQLSVKETQKGIVATIRKGYKIVTYSGEYEVVGYNSLRGLYYYILKDKDGKISTLTRDKLLAGQKTGEISITL